MTKDNVRVANKSILESCSSEIIRVSKSNQITHISSALCHIAGVTESDITTSNIDQLSDSIQHMLSDEVNIELLDHDGHQYQFTHTVLGGDIESGETIHILTNVTTVLDLHHENQRLKEEAKQLQLIDRDTSLLTHRAMLLVLESQVSRCRRYETPLAVVCLSLQQDKSNPDFKLKIMKLSRLLKDQLRWSDMIARSTDNRFTILLPETGKRDTIALIDKLKTTISYWDNCPVEFGMSEWNRNLNVSSLLKECEAELEHNITSFNSGQVVA